MTSTTLLLQLLLLLLMPILACNACCMTSSLNRSLDAAGTLWYLNGATGAPLGKFDIGASIGGGASIARGKVFIDSGYSIFGAGNGGTKTFALKLPGSPVTP
jgi:hypothetical protein